VIEAAPLVLFGLVDLTALNRIAVDVPELFNVFLVAGDVEVVIATMPEMLPIGKFEFASGRLLQNL